VSEAAAPLPPFARAIPGGVELRLKVVPGASRSAIVGALGNRLKVRVAAPPEAGKANRAVVELLAAALGVKDVRITAGHSGPEKTVLIVGLDAEAAVRRSAFGVRR
jgi:uncharacterized protein (TIGR00251 family)